MPHTEILLASQPTAAIWDIYPSRGRGGAAAAYSIPQSSDVAVGDLEWNIGDLDQQAKRLTYFCGESGTR